jgi:chorismate--pyruvate lyase
MTLWHPHIIGRIDDLPLYDWLTAQGSLSEHIRRRCNKGFRVQRLFQGRSRALPDELACLDLPQGSFPLVREVLLLDGDIPLVFARSLAAAKYLDGPWRGLRGLGTKPLATMLFADPGIQRADLEYHHLTARTPLYRRAAKTLDTLPDNLWARRSVFTRNRAPLLVTEVFLPDIRNLGFPMIGGAASDFSART